jgi:WD40 repeat protein
MEVIALDVSPDGLVAAAIADYTKGKASFRVWDVETGRDAFRARPRSYVEDLAWVDDVAWSPDGNHLAISVTTKPDAPDADWDHGSLAVVDRSGDEVAFVPDEEQWVQIRSLAFTRDGERLIGLRSPINVYDAPFGQVAIWDWKGGQIERRIDTGQYEAVLSPGADLLVSTPFNELTSGSQVAEVWAWATGEHLRTLHSSGSVMQATFSRDGSRLATASQDGTVRIWDPHADEPEQLVLHGHTGPVGAVAFSPDGSRLASAGGDGTVRVWALDLDELVDTAERGLTRDLTDAECRQYLHTERCSPT